MATLEIVEFARIGGDADGQSVPVAVVNNNVTVQKVTYTTSTQCSALQSATKFVRITAVSAAAYVAFGSSPTATTSSMLMQADTPEYFAIDQGTLIAAYDGSS